MDSTALVGRTFFLTIVLSVGSVAFAADPAPTSWRHQAEGNYNWNDAANWSGAIPNAKGASADINTGLKGRMTISLGQPTTLGRLNLGETAGKADAANVNITGNDPLTFEGSSPGAPTFLTITQNTVPAGVRLNLAGLRLGGTSALTVTIASPSVFECITRSLDLNGNTFTIEGLRRFFPGDVWHGVNWQIGSISGSGNYIQNGSGTFIQGDCPDFTGTLTVNNGDFKTARLPAVTQYTVAGAFMHKHKFPCGGVMNLTGGPAGATRAPRLNPKATLILRSGGSFICNGQNLDEMAFLGAVRPAVVEQLRQIQFHCGMSEFALDNGNHVASSTTLLVTDPANALVRQQGATVMLSGDGIRTTQGYWAAMGMAEKLIFASGMSAHLKGAGGSPGSKNRSIIPWITIGTVYHPAEGGLATYDDVKGVHSLLEHDEYDDKLAGTPDRNVRCDVLALGTNQTQTVNSLFFGSWGNSDIGAGSTLTITSGALMIGSMGGASIGGTPAAAGTINFGPAEGVVWTPFVTPFGKDITIGSTIAGSGGLTKSATSTLILTASNAYTGKTCVAAGTIQIGNGTTTASKLGDGDVQIASGAILSIKSKVVNAIADNATVVLDNAGTAFFGTMDLDNGVNETVGGLVLDGKAQPAGTYGSKESAADHKLAAYFAGPGIITVTGKGTAGKQ